MAIKDVYNFQKDPYYADLYQAPSLSNQIVKAFSDYQQLESRQLQNQIAERKLQQEQRQLDSADKLSEMMSGGQLTDQADIYAAMQQTMLETGDVQGYLNIAKTREAEEKNEETRHYGIFSMLKENDPIAAGEYYNTHLASKYGAISEDALRPKAKSWREDGQVFYEERDGSIRPGQRYAPSSRGGRGEKEPTYSPVTFEGPNGEIIRLNEKDPANNAKIEELFRNGYKEKTGKEKEPTALEQLLANNLANQLGGSNVLPTKSFPMPSNTPSAMPSPMPSPTPQSKISIPPGVKVNKKIL